MRRVEPTANKLKEAGVKNSLRSARHVKVSKDSTTGGMRVIQEFSNLGSRHEFDESGWEQFHQPLLKVIKL